MVASRCGSCCAHSPCCASRKGRDAALLADARAGQDDQAAGVGEDVGGLVDQVLHVLWQPFVTYHRPADRIVPGNQRRQLHVHDLPVLHPHAAVDHRQVHVDRRAEDQRGQRVVQSCR